ncbi:MAG: RHS repeat domain-containing protein [Salinivirgaceae bacterium]
MALTNTNGTVVEKYSYDAFGNRRNPLNWSQTDTRTNLILDRGYTGHEHLDGAHIINMNGRMYDPIIGRMLSPDPILQNPYSTQNYNRYSYVVNNPLKYTDPSGYQFERLKDRFETEVFDERENNGSLWAKYQGKDLGGDGDSGIPMEEVMWARYRYNANVNFLYGSLGLDEMGISFSTFYNHLYNPSASYYQIFARQEINNSIAGSGLSYTRDPSEVFYGELAQADGDAMSPSNISCLNDCPITTGVDLLNMDSKSIYLSINMWVVFDSKTDTKDFSTNFLSDEYERTILTIHFEARFEPNGAQMFRTGRGFDANRNYFRYEYFDGNGYRDVYGSIPSTKPNYPGAKYWWNDL